MKNNQIIDSYQTFINPQTNIPSDITRLTGITNAMVCSAQSSSAVMRELNRFMGDSLILAHNASFDARFFEAEMSRAGFNVSNRFLCSLLLAGRIYQHLTSHRLDVLCRHIGVINRSSHRALADVEVTHHLFLAYNRGE